MVHNQMNIKWPFSEAAMVWLKNCILTKDQAVSVGLFVATEGLDSILCSPF